MSIVEPIKKRSDLKKIESYFYATSERNLLLFELGINSGLRISDILKLDVKNVKNKKYICLYEKKTSKYKQIPINPKLKLLIKNYTKNKKLSLPLFTSIKGNRLDRISAYRILNKACKSTNIDINIGTHTLRKTFGYHFYKKFKDIIMLQKIFNHSTPNVTLRYIGIEQDEINKKYMKFIL